MARNQRIPYAERVLIATEARRGALQRMVAAKHGVSRSSVNRIAKADRARTSTAPAGQQELPIQRSIQAAGDVVSVCFGDPADIFWAAITQWLHLDVLGQGGPRKGIGDE